MKTKLILALLSTYFFINSNGLAKENVAPNASLPKSPNLLATNYKYRPYLQIGGTRFFNVDSAKAAAGADFFLPLWQHSSQLVFTHIRFFDRSGKPFEGNAHFGYRHLDPRRNHLYGIYGAFDRKRSEFGNYFNQLTFGLEGWLHKIFIGGNFYQPIGPISRPTGIINEVAHFDRIQNNIWITKDSQYERAMGGGDAEIGYELTPGLVGYIGGYYFGAKNVTTICGPKAKFTYDWSLTNGKRIGGIFDKFGLEGGIQRDNPRGTTYYLSANVRIGLLPNQGAKLQGVARHMVDLVRRDVDIVSGSAVATTKELYKDRHGQVIKIVEVAGGSSHLIDGKDLQKALEDPAVSIISIKGHVETFDPASLPAITGAKLLVFNDTVDIVSPFTGKTIALDISSPHNQVGTITTKAMHTLMSINNDAFHNPAMLASDLSPAPNQDSKGGSGVALDLSNNNILDIDLTHLDPSVATQAVISAELPVNLSHMPQVIDNATIIVSTQATSANEGATNNIMIAQSAGSEHTAMQGHEDISYSVLHAINNSTNIVSTAPHLLADKTEDHADAPAAQMSVPAVPSGKQSAKLLSQVTGIVQAIFGESSFSAAPAHSVTIEQGVEAVNQLFDGSSFAATEKPH